MFVGPGPLNPMYPNFPTLPEIPTPYIPPGSIFDSLIYTTGTRSVPFKYAFREVGTDEYLNLDVKLPDDLWDAADDIDEAHDRRYYADLATAKLYDTVAAALAHLDREAAERGRVEGVEEMVGNLELVRISVSRAADETIIEDVDAMTERTAGGAYAIHANEARACGLYGQDWTGPGREGWQHNTNGATAKTFPTIQGALDFLKFEVAGRVQIVRVKVVPGAETRTFVSVVQ